MRPDAAFAARPMTRAGPFVARVLQPQDIRASFVLARFGIPGLRLREWSRLVRRGLRCPATTAIIGVCTQAGCFVALLRISRGDLRLLVVSAVVLGAECEVVAAARAAAPAC